MVSVLLTPSVGKDGRLSVMMDAWGEPLKGDAEGPVWLHIPYVQKKRDMDSVILEVDPDFLRWYGENQPYAKSYIGIVFSEQRTAAWPRSGRFTGPFVYWKHRGAVTIGRLFDDLEVLHLGPFREVLGVKLANEAEAAQLFRALAQHP